MEPTDRRYCLTTVFLFILLAARFAPADPPLDLQIGSASVEVAAVNPTAFRLSVSYTGNPAPSHSVYLAPNQAPVSSSPIKDGNWIGVQSPAGQLLIDPQNAQWTLRDTSGKTLIPPGPIGESTRNTQTGKPFIILNVGCPSDKTFQVYGCGDGADSLLQSQARPHVGNGHAVVPYYWSRDGYATLAISADDNSPPSWTASSDLGRVTWVYAGTSADLYLMPAPTMESACRAYAQLSGPPAVPPRWTFGYLQSRWGWKDRAYIEDAMHQFLSRNLPVDAFIFDFEWFTTTPDYEVRAAGQADYTDFSFNPKLFPDPAAQIAAMKSNGIHAVAIRKPRLGNSALLVMARAKGWILPAANSASPIDTRNLDFHNPAVQTWYAQQLIPLLRQGIDGWWDDEGEINYTQYYWWNTAETQALAQVHPNARLWTIDRAFAPGNQRFGIAAWTGDIPASWPELAKTPTHLLNWSLAGMPYCACDIGGYGGNTTPNLLTRWMEAGVFFPVMRAHSEFSAVPHFPWLFGKDAEDAIRKALDLRYQLIPYLYSLAHEAHETGLPIMRPLAMEFPADSRCANVSDEWLVGKNLLTAPVLDDTNARRIYLPEGTWYALSSGKSIDGGDDFDAAVAFDEIPIYVRAGTILPLGPKIQHTDNLPGGPLQIQVYPGHDAQFTLTEDDGISTAYLSGILRKTNFRWNDAQRTLSWSVDGPYDDKDIFTDITISVFDTGGTKTAKASILTSGIVHVPG
jgi:alpha-glucosidase